MHETQHMARNPIAAVALLIVAAATVWSLLPGSDESPGVAVATTVLLALLASLHLRARSDAEAFRLAYWPLWRRTVPLTSIESATAVTYRPIGDFTGWGIRGGISRRYRGCIAYSVAGTQGVLLRVSDGRDIMFGTQRPDEWLAALAAAGVHVETA